MSDIEGGNLQNSIFRKVFSDAHKSFKITEVPSTLQERYEWSGSDMIYHGYAPRGAANTDALWLVEKWTWDAGNPVSKQTADGSWDDRASLTYS